MIAENEYNTVIIGLGKTGLSCVDFLCQTGQSIAVVDSQKKPFYSNVLQQDYAEIPYFFGTIDAQLLQRAKQIIISPGVSLEHPAISLARAAKIPIYSDIELFCQQNTKPIIGITGTNGKSSVTAMIQAVLEEAGISVAVGGNFGTPALDLLKQQDCEFYILELSSFQLETTYSLNAHASVVLNISADHLDRHKDINTYSAIKQKIYAGDGVMVLNQDDPEVWKMRDKNRRSLSFSVHPEKDADVGIVIHNSQEYLGYKQDAIIEIDVLKSQYQHDIANALATIALAKTIDIPSEAICAALTKFQHLPHRAQRVANINGVDWIDDSKATNTGSCIAAITGLNQPGKIILIAGGDSKSCDMSDLIMTIKRHVKHVFLIGQDAQKISILLRSQDICHQIEDNMRMAVGHAHELSSPGDIVLLSPACASTAPYKNYRERGDDFCAMIKSLDISDEQD